MNGTKFQAWDELQEEYNEFAAWLEDNDKSAEKNVDTSAVSNSAASAAPTSYADEDGHQELAERIKAIQRTSQDGIKRWRNYCFSNGSSSYDPNRHPAHFIAKFLRMDEIGSRSQHHPLILGPNDPKVGLVQRVTQLRNASAECSKAWIAYCDKLNASTYDASRHPADVLNAFVAQRENGHPRQRQDKGECKASLVQRVKQAHRGHAENKRSWHIYCDTHGSSNYDPGRHGEFFLKKYLDAIEAGQREQAYGSSTSSSAGLPPAVAMQAKEMATAFTHVWAQANGCTLPPGFEDRAAELAKAAMCEQNGRAAVGGMAKGAGKAPFGHSSSGRAHTAALLSTIDYGSSKQTRGIVPSSTFSNNEFGILGMPSEERLLNKRGAHLIGSGAAVMDEEQAKRFQETLKRSRN